MLSVTDNNRQRHLHVQGDDRALLAGDPYMLRLTKAIERAAVAAAKGDGRLLLDAVNIAPAAEELAGLLTLTYLEQYRDYNAARRQRRVLMSAYSNVNREIASNIAGIDLGRIEKNFMVMASKNTAESLGRVQSIVNSTLSRLGKEGASKKRRVAGIIEALTSMGVSPANPSLIRNIVGTQISIARNTAQRVRVQQDELIQLLTYFTAGDDRVRQTHVKLNGLVKPKDHPIWASIWPPNGWGCRCGVTGARPGDQPTRLPANAARLVDPEFSFDFVAEFV